MPLISLNPKSKEMLVADFAKATDKFVVVIYANSSLCVALFFTVPVHRLIEGFF